ncbi:MAG: HD domain-containing protein [Patescibacteria group bacterium]
MSDTEKLYSFATALEGLKKIERWRGQFFWKEYPQPHWYESVADHSWRLTMLVLMMAPRLSQKIDLEKALKMALIHDIAEIITGDESPLGEDGTGKSTHAFDERLAQEKMERETQAVRQLFSQLPESDAKEFYDLWLEAEQKVSFEAKVVKALDKLEATLQALEYSDGVLYKEHFEFSIKYSMKYADVDPAIKSFGDEIVQKMTERFKEFTPSTLTKNG